MKGVEHKSGEPAPPPEPARWPWRQQVVESFVVRLRRSLDRRAGEGTGQELNLTRRIWLDVRGARSRRPLREPPQDPPGRCAGCALSPLFWKLTRGGTKIVIFRVFTS
jgi:hypothetical protein